MDASKPPVQGALLPPSEKRQICGSFAMEIPSFRQRSLSCPQSNDPTRPPGTIDGKTSARRFQTGINFFMDSRFPSPWLLYNSTSQRRRFTLGSSTTSPQTLLQSSATGVPEYDAFGHSDKSSTSLSSASSSSSSCSCAFFRFFPLAFSLLGFSAGAAFLGAAVAATATSSNGGNLWSSVFHFSFMSRQIPKFLGMMLDSDNKRGQFARIAFASVTDILPTDANDHEDASGTRPRNNTRER
mmetsp:Transcript_51671/g.135709  ORF Transcript_51671/g.135709 Transcript_51671/m.135709 type:complete len:241 (+) Transcript_51671:372-1094(+)